MDQLNAMRVFVRVVDLGSFSKAAADVGVGQPAVTKLVGQLEQRLGVRLLHRSTHGVTATEIGALFYDKCRLIAHQVEEAENVALLRQSQMQGGLRISTSVAFGRRVLGPLILRFMHVHPQLRIDLSFEDRYVNLVEQGIDVAIRMGRLADSSLGARYLGPNPWVLVASPEYLAKHGKPKTPQELTEHNALVYSTAQGDGRWHFNSSKGAPVTVGVSGTLRSNNLTTLLEGACANIGVAALPWYVAHTAVEQRLVEPILTDWTWPHQDIHAVFPSPRMVPAKVTTFVAWLQGMFGEAWWKKTP